MVRESASLLVSATPSQTRLFSSCVSLQSFRGKLLQRSVSACEPVHGHSHGGVSGTAVPVPGGPGVASDRPTLTAPDADGVVPPPAPVPLARALSVRCLAVVVSWLLGSWSKWRARVPPVAQRTQGWQGSAERLGLLTFPPCMSGTSRLVPRQPPRAPPWHHPKQLGNLDQVGELNAWRRAPVCCPLMSSLCTSQGSMCPTTVGWLPAPLFPTHGLHACVSLTRVWCVYVCLSCG